MSTMCLSLFTASVITVFHLIEAGSQIQAGGQTSFVLIEAGSPIQAGSLIEAGGLNSNIIELGPNCTSPGSTVVHSIIRAYCVISRTAVWPSGYFALHVINIKPRILVF